MLYRQLLFSFEHNKRSFLHLQGTQVCGINEKLFYQSCFGKITTYFSLKRWGMAVLHFCAFWSKVTFMWVTGRAAALSCEVRQSSPTDRSRAKLNAKERKNRVHLESLHIALMARGLKLCHLCSFSLFFPLCDSWYHTLKVKDDSGEI